MKLSTKSRYAAEAMLYIALNDGNNPINLSQIASATGISEHYLAQIAFRLRKAGLLKTRRGTSGGFNLAVPAEQITIGKIMDAMEDSVVPVFCVDHLSQCESKTRDNCVTRSLWVSVAEEISSIVDSLSLAELKKRYEEAGL